MNQEFEPPIHPTHATNDVVDFTSNFNATTEQLDALERQRLQGIAPAVGAIVLELALREAGVSENPDEPPTNELISFANNITKRINLDGIVDFRYLHTKTYTETQKAVYQDLAVQMQERRVKAGLSQVELAEKLEVSRFTVIRLEGRKQKMSLKYARKLDELDELRPKDEADAHEPSFSFAQTLINAFPELSAEQHQQDEAVRMRELRARLGITQDKFGRLLGRTPLTVRKYENGSLGIPPVLQAKLDEIEAELNAESKGETQPQSTTED